MVSTGAHANRSEETPRSTSSSTHCQALQVSPPVDRRKFVAKLSICAMALAKRLISDVLGRGGIASSVLDGEAGIGQFSEDGPKAVSLRLLASSDSSDCLPCRRTCSVVTTARCRFLAFLVSVSIVRFEVLAVACAMTVLASDFPVLMLQAFRVVAVAVEP